MVPLPRASFVVCTWSHLPFLKRLELASETTRCFLRTALILHFTLPLNHSSNAAVRQNAATQSPRDGNWPTSVHLVRVFCTTNASRAEVLLEGQRTSSAMAWSPHRSASDLWASRQVPDSQDHALLSQPRDLHLNWRRLSRGCYNTKWLLTRVSLKVSRTSPFTLRRHQSISSLS